MGHRLRSTQSDANLSPSTTLPTQVQCTHRASTRSQVCASFTRADVCLSTWRRATCSGIEKGYLQLRQQQIRQQLLPRRTPLRRHDSPVSLSTAHGQLRRPGASVPGLASHEWVKGSSTVHAHV